MTDPLDLASFVRASGGGVFDLRDDHGVVELRWIVDEMVLSVTLAPKFSAYVFHRGERSMLLELGDD